MRSISSNRSERSERYKNLTVFKTLNGKSYENPKDFHSIRAHEVILSNMRISGKMNTNKNVYKIIRKNHAFLYAPILKWGWCF
ncbi:MAG: hypothetical protein PWP15_1382 [Methanothermococcus sp.]|jgi:hypothetical protein|nr:hypothetical protein [Methanothermococcus sp.]MDK2987826.1 hypothetical protein [Methanothermococcus sp.]